MHKFFEAVLSALGDFLSHDLFYFFLFPPFSSRTNTSTCTGCYVDC